MRASRGNLGERPGRDPDLLELTLGHLVSRITPEKGRALADLGATRILLAPTPTEDLGTVLSQLTDCADRLGLTA